MLFNMWTRVFVSNNSIAMMKLYVSESQTMVKVTLTFYLIDTSIVFKWCALKEQTYVGASDTSHNVRL